MSVIIVLRLATGCSLGPPCEEALDVFSGHTGGLRSRCFLLVRAARDTVRVLSCKSLRGHREGDPYLIFNRKAEGESLDNGLWVKGSSCVSGRTHF